VSVYVLTTSRIDVTADRQSLEGLPKMSRLTINGSQNLDYLSRHISLQIRETGIYTVRGSEKEGAEWRMRYMVNKAPPCLRPEDRVCLLQIQM
jgi:hypothetical protein